MRWIGALILVGAGGMAGLVKVRTIRQQIDLMDELVAWIVYLKNELTQRGTPLPELLMHYKPNTVLPLKELSAFAKQGKALDKAAECWLYILDIQTVAVIRDFLGVLGRYDSHTQRQACDLAQSRLEQHRNTLQLQLKQNGSMYRAVPLALGMMAALVLL